MHVIRLFFFSLLLLLSVSARVTFFLSSFSLSATIGPANNKKKKQKTSTMEGTQIANRAAFFSLVAIATLIMHLRTHVAQNMGQSTNDNRNEITQHNLCGSSNINNISNHTDFMQSVLDFIRAAPPARLMHVSAEKVCRQKPRARASSSSPTCKINWLFVVDETSCTVYSFI